MNVEPPLRQTDDLADEFVLAATERRRGRAEKMLADCPGGELAGAPSG